MKEGYGITFKNVYPKKMIIADVQKLIFAASGLFGVWNPKRGEGTQDKGQDSNFLRTKF